MKAKKRNIKIQGSGDFQIIKNKIIETNGEIFTVEEEGEDLILSVGGINIGSNNTVNFGGRSNSAININGLSISTRGKTLIVNGNVDSVIVNGKEYTNGDNNTNEKEEELAENEYKEYSLKHVSIKAITLSGSGSIIVDENEITITLENPISLTLAGSGDIKLYNFSELPIVASVAGSGDIYLYNINGESITAVVAGSGDITARKSSFKTVNKTVVGSGEINGL